LSVVVVDGVRGRVGGCQADKVGKLGNFRLEGVQEELEFWSESVLGKRGRGGGDELI
jgi:hypothetical protein